MKHASPTTAEYQRAISAWRKTVAEWEEADFRSVEAVHRIRKNDRVPLETPFIAYCEQRLSGAEVKTDKDRPMTDKQAKQMEDLGLPVDRAMTIHGASSIISRKLAECQKSTLAASAVSGGQGEESGGDS